MKQFGGHYCFNIHILYTLHAALQSNAALQIAICIVIIFNTTQHTHTHTQKKACYKMLHRALEMVSPFEDKNEPSASIKGWVFLGLLSEY
jgi:hypothetical protein